MIGVRANEGIRYVPRRLSVDTYGRVGEGLGFPGVLGVATC